MAKITPERSTEMFDTARIHRASFMSALVAMGPSHLKTAAMREDWMPDNPTKNYCYVITEWFKYYYAPRSLAWKLDVPGYDGFGTIEGAPVLHYFNMNGPDLVDDPKRWTEVVDLAAEQFDNYEWVQKNYKNAVPVKNFMFTPTKRARLLQELYLTELSNADAPLWIDTMRRLDALSR